MIERSTSASPLRVLFTLGATGSMTDGDLLRRYLDGRPDEAECAFATLVDRHGPMVRHVCLSILGDPHDAADAFQAAFLVLARRAGAIRKAESVGPWLFGVSRRVALRAKTRAARRRRAERIKAEQVSRQPRDEPPLPDDWAVLYHELDRLPARYRDPLVLCYLQGLTHDQAAARLGIPTPTLRTRLFRARDRLRSRLLRRGLTPSSASALLLAPVPLNSASVAFSSIGWASAAAQLALASRGVSLATLSVPLATSTLRSMVMLGSVRSFALGGVIFATLGIGAAGFSTLNHSGEGPNPKAPPRPDPALSASADSGPSETENSTATRDETPTRPGSDAIRVFSEIDSEIRLISLLPNGTAVQKDQRIAELDANSLKDQLANQQIATERAHADYQGGIKTREIAELGINSYLNGTYPLELLEAEGELEIARAEYELAQSSFERKEEMHSRSIITDEELKRARIDLLRAELQLSKAEKVLEVLTQQTRDHHVRTLELAVEQARAEELAKQARFIHEQETEERIRRMIEHCRLYAPADGIVRYADEVAEGATITRGQLLFWIEPVEAANN